MTPIQLFIVRGIGIVALFGCLLSFDLLIQHWRNR